MPLRVLSCLYLVSLLACLSVGLPLSSLSLSLASVRLLQGAESDPTHFTDKIEINDYPQQARWKITQKSTVNEVVEITGVAIITKGEW